jgi:hypothetical protein
MPPPPPPSELEGETEAGERRGAKRKVPEDSTIPAEENFKCERDLSRFEKLGKLEEGAFGVVYRARDRVPPPRCVPLCLSAPLTA